MRNPLRRRWRVERYRRDPFNGNTFYVPENPPAPVARLFWSRSGAEVEALRLCLTVSVLRRGTEGYRVVRRG
jgi:hypothetical protein